jgi:hypothetical protein
LRATPALTRPELLLKIPTWIGLLFLAGCTLRLCLPHPRRSPNALAEATPTLS